MATQQTADTATWQQKPYKTKLRLSIIIGSFNELLSSLQGSNKLNKMLEEKNIDLLVRKIN